MTKLINKVFRITYRGENIDISANIRQTEGDLILFLHGMGCNKESFNNAFRVRALRSYSICAFDFPGHGASSRLPGALYSLQTFADITNKVIQGLAFGRIYMVGHSMGGAVGIIASQARNRIEYLVSADGNLVAEDCSLASRKIADQPSMTFINEGFGQFLKLLQGSSRRDYIAWFNWCRNADPQALHQAARSLVEWSDSGRLLELFNSLTRKAYLYGDQDDKEYVLPQIAAATISAIPSAGHFMMIDNPRSFYQELAGVLTRQLRVTASPHQITSYETGGDSTSSVICSLVISVGTEARATASRNSRVLTRPTRPSVVGSIPI